MSVAENINTAPVGTATPATQAFSRVAAYVCDDATRQTVLQVASDSGWRQPVVEIGGIRDVWEVASKGRAYRGGAALMSAVSAIDQALTTDTTAVQTAVDAWEPGGGGDAAEDQLHALTLMAGGAPGPFLIQHWRRRRDSLCRSRGSPFH